MGGSAKKAAKAAARAAKAAEEARQTTPNTAPPKSPEEVPPLSERVSDVESVATDLMTKMAIERNESSAMIVQSCKDAARALPTLHDIGERTRDKRKAAQHATERGRAVRRKT